MILFKFFLTLFVYIVFSYFTDKNKNKSMNSIYFISLMESIETYFNNKSPKKPISVHLRWSKYLRKNAQNQTHNKEAAIDA